MSVDEPIGDLTDYTTPIGTDYLPIVDITNNITKRIDYDLVSRDVVFAVALSDETTVLPTASTTVPLLTFHMPFAFTVTGVKAGLTTAGTGAALVTVDIHEAGTTILGTKITIDATEKTSATAVTQPTITDASLAADSLIECFLDLRDTNNVATGLKVYIIGHRT